MTIFKKLSLSSFLLAVFACCAAIPAMAGVTVNEPVNGASVSSPFTLSAVSTSCSSQSVSTMGYSLDSSSDTTVVNDTSIDAKVASGSGAHTLHVKSWGDKGASCVTDIAITVSGTTDSSTGDSVVPSDAVSVSSIQALSGWQKIHDTGTSGSSSGSMSLVNSPAHSGNARKFVTTFSNAGGERYSKSFGDNTSSSNFFYDGWVYIGGSASGLANIEMDLNQVMDNGQTVIFGFQCDGYSGTWDYSVNKGTPDHPTVEWLHSGAACNPRSWGVNAWHHVQVSYSRSDGNVTYHDVWLDGKEGTVNGKGLSAFALGWAPTLQTNFQIDGLGSSGSSTVYLDDLIIYRW